MHACNEKDEYQLACVHGKNQSNLLKIRQKNIVSATENDYVYLTEHNSNNTLRKPPASARGPTTTENLDRFP